jgi:hypothetical protein
MDTQPSNNEAARLEAVNQQLCQKIVDLEAEIERKNKSLEGFIAENEALKAELAGTGKETRAGGNAKDGTPLQKNGGGSGRMIERLTRALEEAAKR